jgi:hypothetical protein
MAKDTRFAIAEEPLQLRWCVAGGYLVEIAEVMDQQDVVGNSKSHAEGAKMIRGLARMPRYGHSRTPKRTEVGAS